MMKNPYFRFSIVVLSTCLSMLNISCYNKYGSTAPAVGGNSVSTFAGSGSVGAVNATGTAASFYTPYQLAIDSSNNIYVADFDNSLIRKITPDGVVSTLAGSGSYAFADGQGTSASFDGPAGVAVDAAGNVYVGDVFNQRIREISPSGYVSTIAGTGAVGSGNGTGSNVSFTDPYAVAVDSTGNVYVADELDHLVRKITPGLVVSTLAGSGISGDVNATGTAASFTEPLGIAVDSSGNVYVADADNNQIREISPAGVVSTLAGSGAAGKANGTGTAATFNFPTGVTVDPSGNVYVADEGNEMIRKISPSGQVTTYAGTGQFGTVNGSAGQAEFSAPWGVALNSSGDLFVSDSFESVIREITP